jgi:hypothetical protein
LAWSKRLNYGSDLSREETRMTPDTWWNQKVLRNVEKEIAMA